MSTTITRRELSKMALAALPASRLLAKPNSRFGGVQIGINAPYSFHGVYNNGDECLSAIVKLDLSSVKLRAPIEQFMGAPANLVAYPAVRPAGCAAAAPGTTPWTSQAAPRGGRAPLTPERQAARKAAADELRNWRLAASMDTVKAFRGKYEDAGVKIEIVKVDAIETFSDEEIDYMFGLARTAGANAISCEIPLSHTKRLGAYHDRVTHIHLKDRKLNNGPNIPWGMGDTPI
ncbi:MAG: hypothetical protein ABSG03_10445 [Bryobacteraceae bacterium]